jgi:hypothetical protein
MSSPPSNLFQLPLPQWAYVPGLPGDGFADSFPVAALTAVLTDRLARPALAAGDWVAIGATGRP